MVILAWFLSPYYLRGSIIEKSFLRCAANSHSYSYQTTLHRTNKIWPHAQQHVCRDWSSVWLVDRWSLPPYKAVIPCAITSRTLIWSFSVKSSSTLLEPSNESPNYIYLSSVTSVSDFAPPFRIRVRSLYPGMLPEDKLLRIVTRFYWIRYANSLLLIYDLISRSLWNSWRMLSCSIWLP